MLCRVKCVSRYKYRNSPLSNQQIDLALNHSICVLITLDPPFGELSDSKIPLKTFENNLIRSFNLTSPCKSCFIKGFYQSSANFITSITNSLAIRTLGKQISYYSMNNIYYVNYGFVSQFLFNYLRFVSSYSYLPVFCTCHPYFY